MTEPTQAHVEDYIESAFWEFDTIRKGGSYGERDAFKIAARKLIARIRREASDAALEKAAQLCHELMMSMRYGSPVFDGEDADDFDQGRAAGAEHCRNALRALKDQP